MYKCITYISWISIHTPWLDHYNGSWVSPTLEGCRHRKPLRPPCSIFYLRSTLVVNLFWLGFMYCIKPKNKTKNVYLCNMIITILHILSYICNNNKEVKKHVNLIIYSYLVSLSPCLSAVSSSWGRGSSIQSLLVSTDHDSALILLRESGGKPDDDDDDRRVGRHTE